jgi:hypothetical protein
MSLGTLAPAQRARNTGVPRWSCEEICCRDERLNSGIVTAKSIYSNKVPYRYRVAKVMSTWFNEGRRGRKSGDSCIICTSRLEVVGVRRDKCD